jgi:hypothetical protein
MIYLRERGGQYVGPFKTRQDAERIKLMELCCENWAGTESWRRKVESMLWRRTRIASSDGGQMLALFTGD